MTTSAVLSDALSARVRALAPSPTMAVDARAKALKAAGEDVIGFGAGEPDFPTPPHVVEAAQRACADPRMHRYSPAAGMPALREAIAAVTARDAGIAIAPSQVLVSNGGKHALFNAFAALVDPGDEVLLPAPYWVSYPEQVRLFGGVVVELPTTVEAGFRVTIPQLDAAVTPRTKALVFVSPSNPSGAVYPPEEVEAIGRWAVDRGLWVVTDEIYEHLVYGDARHVSMPAVVPELRERCVIVNGVAKTYAMTGWRVGWAVAPEPLIAKMAALQGQTTTNVANIAQAAAVAALTGGLDAAEEMRRAYDRRRRVAAAGLDAIEGVTCALPEGAFYVFPSFEGVLGRELGGRPTTTTEELCEALLEVARVAIVPGEGFGAPGYARLSYALGDADLERGIERIARALA